MISTDRFGLLKIFGGGSYYNNENVLFEVLTMPLKQLFKDLRIFNSI